MNCIEPIVRCRSCGDVRRWEEVALRPREYEHSWSTPQVRNHAGLSSAGWLDAPRAIRYVEVRGRGAWEGTHSDNRS